MAVKYTKAPPNTATTKYTAPATITGPIAAECVDGPSPDKFSTLFILVTNEYRLWFGQFKISTWRV